MKKSKVRLLIVGIVILLIVGIVASRFLPAKVTLSSVKKGDTYQFMNFKWGVSPNAVKLLWTDSLEPYELRGQEAYLSRDSAKIEGKTADVYFYFQDEKLYQVSMTIKACDETWFSELLADTRQMYGEETASERGTSFRWEEDGIIFGLHAVGDQTLLSLTNESGT